MNNLKNILVAVDFSTGSRAALEQAGRIAGVSGAALHVLHVVDSGAIAALAISHKASGEHQTIISIAGARAALARWVEMTSTLPTVYETHVVAGVPLHEILDHAEEIHADLLVAGIAGAGESAAGAGSVSMKLARKSRTQVLLVRADHPHAFKRIVACIDFSDTAAEVVAQAHRIAAQEGARVDFLHIWQDPMLSMQYGVPMAEMGAPPVMSTLDFREEYTQNIRAALEAFVGAAARGIESEGVLYESSSYGMGIAAHAEEVKADLIVIGSKGRTNLRYVLLGSTAERLMTRLPCSALVVKLADGRAEGWHTA